MNEKLTPAEAAMYREQGFYVPRFRFDAADTAKLKSRVDRLIGRHPELHNKSIPDILQIDADEEGYNREFMEFARRPELLDMAESILGPDLIAWTGTVFHKPAEIGYETKWHQDGAYWPMDPMATVSVWIAVTDSAIDNGCLRVIPRSQSRRYPHVTLPNVEFHQSVSPDAMDETQAVDIELEAGQMLLFDSMLIHGGRANTGRRERSNFTIRYMPSTSWFDYDLMREHDYVRDPTTPPYSRKKIYLVRGVNRCARNDLRRNQPPHWDPETFVREAARLAGG